ncbi:HEAT repeat domain-containing protein [Ruania alba]|uniref:HEAT repeat domain-containing protein n=1 Tax=Ruania alba TaxID=648782 RepID=A0A1H5KAC1_9MICO|nr:HEAT repeat domain-containing protein [Ruania alba]SEE61813.1 hypothetical protein SAMN04488554_2166 [Ruania alba]
MSTPQHRPSPERVQQALAAANASTRLRAAMAAGTYPHTQLLDPLLDRAAIEPDFFVRDMLTWALTRHPATRTVPRLLAELDSDRGQARSQALHTLSKIGAGQAWQAVRGRLQDPDPEVARSAWRAAVVLAPIEERAEVIRSLGALLGHGDREVRLSLSRALITLASSTESAGRALHATLEAAAISPDPAVREHASATESLWHDPDAGFEVSVAQAQKVRARAVDPQGQAG